MDGLSQILSVEMKLGFERRIFINMALVNSVKTDFDRRCSVVFFFYPKANERDKSAVL